MPLNYDPLSYSTFNHISLTALAIQYCESFIEDNSNVEGSVILGIPESDGDWANKVSSAMVNRFAFTEVNQDPFLPFIQLEMVNAMKVENGILRINNYHNKVVIGCTVFLASSYFSFD